MPDFFNSPTTLITPRGRTGLALGVASAMVLTVAGVFAMVLNRASDVAAVAPVKQSVVVFHDDPASHEFIQSTALSHVAPLRPETPEPVVDPARPADRSVADKPKARAANKPASKPTEVAVLPPIRPQPERVVVAEAEQAPKPEPRRILGIEVNLPSMPSVPDFLPSPKQVRERASEWADKIASAVNLR